LNGIQAEPDYRIIAANTWTASCLIHSYLGNTDTAIDHFQKAQRLNPLDLSQHLHWNTIAWVYLGAGRYQEAAEAADKTLRIQPDYPPGLRLGAVTCALLGRMDEARAHTARMLAKQPNTTIAWMREFLRVPLQRNKKALDWGIFAEQYGSPTGNRSSERCESRLHLHRRSANSWRASLRTSPRKYKSPLGKVWPASR
jgi:tetratricopeptide (TPR) repeat protein